MMGTAKHFQNVLKRPLRFKITVTLSWLNPGQHILEFIPNSSLSLTPRTFRLRRIYKSRNVVWSASSWNNRKQNERSWMWNGHSWAYSLWQVTAYRHLIYISPRCVISCLTHIYSVPFTHNTTHPHLIYIYLISGDQTKGRFCELRSGMVQPLTEVSMAYPKNESTLPETFRGEWVPIGFENQLSPL